MLELQGIHTYHDYLHVLKGIDLRVEQGEIFAILGSNGAGKSTLLGTIAGIYKPRQGTIRFDGEDVTKLSAQAMVRKGISLVPERRQIFDALTVDDNLRLGAYHRYRRERKQVEEDLRQVYALFPKLKTMEKRLGGLLSGGEQQMLAVGRGLMSNPRLIMLDEPSLGLAPLIVKDIMANLTKLRDAFGTTVVLVEQNVKAALAVADRACVLERGEVAVAGTSAELRDNATVKDAYLGKTKKTEPL
ncbi:MAG TPA: ABC transporter ATP-binding protein [Bacillales bacterium]|nr:ABC transporter ATP-binding protein [Bacillales bacterium]